ncbi:calumenin-like [Telopea speciosissima]|uniref:calumenin-like n=1 Tax=Telopea speciosissima TaxID=54955 RepID=UPI001CC3477E|nr:calumenin-like [Telopea speciosissima]
MGKASVIIYISVALLLLFLISHSPKGPKTNRRRRLKLRSTFTFDKQHHEPVAFVPLIADMERRREDKEWEKRYFEHTHKEFIEGAPGAEAQPEWEEFVNDEDYLNDEERLNITSRLVLLFPKIDVDPVDGFVTESEMTEWNLQKAERDMMRRTERDMELHDKNHDGFVSFAEHRPSSWVRNSDNTSFRYNMDWWKEERFNASDADGDGLLNPTEFNDILNPPDSNNPKVIRWLCKKEVRYEV